MNLLLTTVPTPEHFHTEEVSQQTIILEGNMSDTAIEDDNSEQNEKKEEETTATTLPTTNFSHVPISWEWPSLSLNRSRMMTWPSFNF